jgi:Sulfotransferase family
LGLFQPATPEQRIGEASESYLWSARAAKAIAEVQPEARIIAILREPASFLRSLHLQYAQARVETEHDFATALSLEQERRREIEAGSGRGRPAKALLYSDHVRYVDQLRRYHAVFPKEQILVLIYDDFRADNEATVRRVLSFVGVDEVGSIELLDANPTVRVRSPRAREMIRSLYMGHGPVARGAKSMVKAVTFRRLRHEALKVTQRRLVYGAPRPSDDRIMLQLRRRFRGEVVAVSEYLGRDLVGEWGYDELDPT